MTVKMKIGGYDVASYGYVMEYTPKPGALKDETTTEKALLMLTTSARSFIRQVQSAFWTAQKYASGELTVDRITVDVDLGDGQWWSSEITDGQILSTDKTLDLGLLGPMEVEVAWTRKNFWEADWEMCDLLSKADLAETTAVEVWNHSDADLLHGNWAEITTEIEGDLPAATRLTIENTTAADVLGHVWVGLRQKEFYPAITSGIVLECETGMTSPNVADASSSAGYYYQVTLDNSVSEQAIRYWSLTNAQMDYCGGKMLKALVRFADVADMEMADLQLRIKLTWHGITVWDGPWHGPNTEHIWDVGTFRVPPWSGFNSLYDAGMTGFGIDPVDVWLMARYTGEGGLSANSETPGTPVGLLAALTGTRMMINTAPLGQAYTGIDYVALIPVDGGWRHYEPLAGGGVGVGEALIDDYLLDQPYTTRSGYVGGMYAAYGEPLMLLPGETNVLYVAQHSATVHRAQIERTVNVSISYRPRRMSL